MKPDSRALETRFNVAVALAREAGQVAKRRFLDRKSFTIGFKGPQDYLTEVDGEVERLIAARVQSLFPEDGFIGEEGDDRIGRDGAAIWVVDPIDGTSNFARGAPHFCVSIARRGAGASVNGAPIAVSTTTELKAASIEVGWNMRSGAHRFLALMGRIVDAGAAVVRSGSGALGLAYVAAGRRDGYVENHLNAWDCLAGVALVREAGGYVSDYLTGDGLHKGNPILACNPRLREALLKTSAIEGLAP